METTGFRIFGGAHWVILAALAALAVVLLRVCRAGTKDTRRAVRVGLGVTLAVNELVWWTYRYSQEGFRFPEGLPLQLCDIAVWLTTAAALLPRRVLLFEIAYFLGLAGSGMALLTPDLWAPLLSYPSLYFFLAHGLVAVTLVVLVASGMAHLRPGSVWRALVAVNVFALFVGSFNAIFGTNYMYLSRKPASASLLDFLGPWPWYLLAGELAAVLLFWLLWLPVRKRASSGVTASKGG